MAITIEPIEIDFDFFLGGQNIFLICHFETIVDL